MNEGTPLYGLVSCSSASPSGSTLFGLIKNGWRVNTTNVCRQRKKRFFTNTGRGRMRSSDVLVDLGGCEGDEEDGCVVEGDEGEEARLDVLFH